MTFPTIVVEVDFTYGGAVGTTLILDSATKGLLDTNTLSVGAWTDITTYAQGVSTKRGASRAEGPLLRFEAGTLTVTLDNSDRRFDPTNLSGPYVAGAVTQVVPMRPVRVTAVHNGTTYPLFRGYVDQWALSYAEPSYATCTMTATDAVKVLSNYDRVALGSPVGAGESSGARVGRILDSVGWETGADYRDIAAGDSTMQGTTMDRSGWEELLNVQDSEIGRVYVDAAGRVVFRGRHSLMEDPTSATSQATFGDDVGQLPFVSADVSYDDTGLANLVRVSVVGGTQQIAQDTPSQQKYLVHTHDRTDLMLQTDAQAADYASFLLAQTKDPELRFTSMAINGNDDQDALFPQILGRDFGDRITLTRRPPGGGTLTRDSFVVGVTHEVPGPNEWRTTWALQSATKWAYMTLDSTTFGLLDTNPLGF